MLDRAVVLSSSLRISALLALLAAAPACSEAPELEGAQLAQLECAPAGLDGCSSCATDQGPLTVCERPGAGKVDGQGCVGDVNADGKVSFADLQEILGAWGSHRDDPGYTAARDVNDDGVVNHKDFGAVIGNLGCKGAPPTEPVPAPATAPELLPAELRSPAERPAEWTQIEDSTLALINERRAAGATCGDTWYPPVGPLALQQQIRAAAREHSADMAEHGYFSHIDLEGNAPMDRMLEAGFSGMAFGENIAAGQPTPAVVVDAWMNSPGHCENIMSPLFTLSGVGYVAAPTSVYRHFWTQNFGG